MATEEELTPTEQQLVRSVTDGTGLDLLGGDDPSQAAMDEWDDARTIRARVLRDILRGRLAPDPDPSGLRLQGARIAGKLDLRYLTSEIPLCLVACSLPDGINATLASLRTLVLDQCLVRNGVELGGAHVRGMLTAYGATFVNDSGPALNAHGLVVDNDLRLEDGMTARGKGDHGAVNLIGARIQGRLIVSGTLTNDSGPALFADVLEVGSGLEFLDGLTATGAGLYGVIRMANAVVRGGLHLSSTSLINDSGPAFDADGLTVDGRLILELSPAQGRGPDGTVRLPDARISGDMLVSGSLTNSSGRALSANGVTIQGNLHLLDGFRAQGSGSDGTVDLNNATVGGSISLSRVTLFNDSGPALTANALKVDQDLGLRENCRITAAGEHAAVVLSRARIGRDLTGAGTAIGNESGPAVDATELSVGGSVNLLAGFVAVGSATTGTLRLTAARVGGRLDLDPSQVLHPSGEPGLLAIDGLTYANWPAGWPLRSWLAVIAHQTASYAAQPYRHLAALTQAAGHDDDTRRILIEQRRDQLRRTPVAWPARVSGRVTGAVLGYGYKPWRALVCLLGVVGVAMGMTLAGGSRGGLEQPGGSGAACTTVEEIGVALDISLPLLKTGAADSCTVTATTAGSVVTVGGWILQLTAWAFATLFVAGFTSAVRKT